MENNRLKNRIKYFFKGKEKYSAKTVWKFLNENPDIMDFCRKILSEFPEWETEGYVCFYKTAKETNLRKCKECGNPIRFSRRKSRFCSRKYGNSSSHKDLESYRKNSNFINNNPMKTDAALKAENTNREKYGCSRKNMAEFYNRILEKWKDHVIPLFSKNEYFGKSNIYPWKCAKCRNEFRSRIYSTKHLGETDEYIPRCLKCYPKFKGNSKPEKELFEFCLKFFKDCTHNDRLVIPGRELDIYISELKLAIEFNGIYYHCIKWLAEKYGESEACGYHLKKTEACEKLGIRLIHIWEDEWLSDKEQIKQRLTEIFMGSEKLLFSEDIIKLNKCWYPVFLEIPGYELKETEQPSIEWHGKYLIENCGYLIYRKKKWK